MEGVVLAVKVKFKSTPTLPTWLHRPGGKTVKPYRGRTSLRLCGPVNLIDGDRVEMTPWEAQWATHHYPQNFENITRERTISKYHLNRVWRKRPDSDKE